MPADVSALFEAGRDAWLRNEPERAAEFLRAALALAPDDGDIAFALGCALLKTGDLPSGYPYYNRWRSAEAGRRAAPRLPLPRWDGTPLDGRHLLVWGEDGFGDQLMYLRYAIGLRDRGARVSWVCPPPLARLIDACGVTALANDQSFTISDADAYCPSSQLAAALGVTYASLSGKPYLARPAPRGAGGRVGIMTFSAPHHGDGAAKTLPPAAAARLQQAPHAVNLAPEATGARDFLDTAAILCGLDCVVSVDTAVAHLGGALGVPTFVLLPSTPDWRWFTERTDSPWYDSVTLIRQGPDGWGGSVERALEHIGAF